MGTNKPVNNCRQIGLRAHKALFWHYSVIMAALALDSVPAPTSFFSNTSLPATDVHDTASEFQ